jgi:hypothetical protein
LKLTAATSITFLDSLFVQLINDILDKSPGDVSNGVILNFRDPTYSAESGGLHPVEISIDPEGNLQYITDFSYAGIPPCAELEKELDWDFTCNRFSQFGRDFDLECGRALLGLYIRNFCAYFESGVYEITVTSQFDRSHRKSIQST